MDKKTFLLALVSVLFLSGFLPVVSAHSIERRHHIIAATVYEPETVDPAWAYDTASQELIFNVYEPLIFFEVDRALPPEEQGKTGVFVPSLATEWTLSSDEYTFTFKIRDVPPVMFHNGATLTAEDVEYSFERWMVQCRAGGPAWMILEPLLYIYSTRARAGTWDWYLGGAKQLALDIAASVESNSTHVWFNLHPAFPCYPPFLAIIAQSWAGILNKEWCIAHGDWPGTWGYGIDAGPDWTDYSDPEVSPLDEGEPKMCGTGPYKFDYWEKGVEWSIVWNPDYWQAWPAPLPCQGALYPEGWIKRVTTQFIPEWSTRKMMFLACDVDFCYVPRMHIPEMILNYPAPSPRKETEKYVPGIRCYPDLPTLVCSPCMFFTLDIDPASPYLGPGFDQANPYVIGQDRIPVNFFSDINVRKAFAYSFDYDTYIRDVYRGEAKRLYVCIPEPVPYFNPDQCGYKFDLAKAEEHLKLAWCGEIWEKGFTMGVTYNTGNIPRMKACEMLKHYVEGINPKFHIEICELWWPIYLKQRVWRWLTLFIIGWLADYPDAHNFVFPFMHTYGDFAYFQRYSNPQIDELIEAGIATPDLPYVETLTVTNTTAVDMTDPVCSYWTVGADTYHLRKWNDAHIPYTVTGDGVLGARDYVEMHNTATGEKKWYHVESITGDGTITMDLEFSRKWIYYQLQKIYVEECISVPLAYPTERHWEREWMMGWYYNAIYPGPYWYHYWKGYYGDCDKDYDVDLDDLYCVLVHYCESVPPAPPECDFDKDGRVDLHDLYWVLVNYGC